MIKELNCSRTSLRNALSRLSSEGLIKIIPNKGAVVDRLSVKAMKDIQYVIQGLEAIAARQAAQSHNDIDLKLLEDNIVNLKHGIDIMDYKIIGETIYNFRLTLFSITQNNYLIETLNRYYSILFTNAQTYDCVLDEEARHIYKELLVCLEELYEAIKQGDVELATSLAIKQSEYSKTFVKGNPLYASI